jgi:hypothetical protein
MAAEARYDETLDTLARKKHEVIQTASSLVMNTSSPVVEAVVLLLRNAEWRACLEGRTPEEIDESGVAAVAEALLPESTSATRDTALKLALSVVSCGSLSQTQIDSITS